MVYNKAKAEQEWLCWKENEEKILREKGVTEDTIQRLHTYDWAQFNKERRYRQNQTVQSEFLEKAAMPETEMVAENVSALLESIENEQLHNLLAKTDSLTLQALLYKTQGFSSKEIAGLLESDELAINMRIYRLRKKIKKYF